MKSKFFIVAIIGVLLAIGTVMISCSDNNCPGLLLGIGKGDCVYDPVKTDNLDTLKWCLNSSGNDRCAVYNYGSKALDCDC
jgi:hypothetical protein